MSSPVSRHRRGAHRSGRGLLHALMPSLLAVVAVAALVTSLAVWRGDQGGQPRAAATTTSPTAPSREALSRAPSTSAPVVTGGSGDTGSSSATASRSPSPSKKSKARTSTSDAPATARRDVEVVVLNETRRGGLAGSVADLLRGGGWTVPVVGNFRGTVSATTVYYPVGAEAAAQAAAESLPTVPRIRPRFGNLSTSRLTVVVTDSYPG